MTQNTKYFILASTFVAGFGILLFSLPALSAKPEGAPPSTESEKNFFNSAHPASGGIPCCSEADGFREGLSYPEELNSGYPHPGGIILREWMPSKDVPGGYRVNILGIWKDISPDKVVKSPPNPPNITGGAVIWITWPSYSSGHLDQITNMTIRCFAKGNEF